MYNLSMEEKKTQQFGALGKGEQNPWLNVQQQGKQKKTNQDLKLTCNKSGITPLHE